MEDLRDKVTPRRRRFAGHEMHLSKERPAKVATRWTPAGAKRKRGRHENNMAKNQPRRPTGNAH